MAAKRTEQTSRGAVRRAGPPTGFILYPDEAGFIADDWTTLYADAAEKNPFFAPWCLAPALAAFADPDVRLACARNAEGLLIGLAPLVTRRVYARLPLRFAEVWRHPHAFYGAPLLRRGFEGEAAQSLLDAAEAMPFSPAFLRLTEIDGDGASAAAFVNAPQRLAYVSDVRQRPILKAGAGEPLAKLSGKRRSELRRRRARLAERGGLVFRQAMDAADVTLWTEEFLALERLGWKGGAGTALEDCARSARYFRNVVAGAFAAGALRFVKLESAGDTAAAAVNFCDSGEGYGFKICINEAFSRYSPGVLLAAEIDAAFATEPCFKFFDTCAGRDQPWTEGLWPARRRVIGLNVSLRGAAGAAQLRAARLVEGSARLLQPSLRPPARPLMRRRAARHAV